MDNLNRQTFYFLKTCCNSAFSRKFNELDCKTICWNSVTPFIISNSRLGYAGSIAKLYLRHVKTFSNSSYFINHSPSIIARRLPVNVKSKYFFQKV